MGFFFVCLSVCAIVKILLPKVDNFWAKVLAHILVSDNTNFKKMLFDLNFKIAADYDFMLRVLIGGIKVKYLPEVLYKMRAGGESNKSLRNILLKLLVVVITWVHINCQHLRRTDFRKYYETGFVHGQ